LGDRVLSVNLVSTNRGNPVGEPDRKFLDSMLRYRIQSFGKDVSSSQSSDVTGRGGGGPRRAVAQAPSERVEGNPEWQQCRNGSRTAGKGNAVKRGTDAWLIA